MSHAGFWVGWMGLALLIQIGLLARWIRDARVFPRIGLRSTRRLPPDPPLLSVVVPARNEEQMIRRCLEALCASEYGNLEVLVLDDRSQDRTGEIVREVIARDPRVRCLTGTPTPEGWAGKNWAIHQAASEAHGRYLLIVDADTVLHPRCLPEVMAYAIDEAADLVTLFPRVSCESFWERTILPALASWPSFPIDRINDPARRDANAFGYFLFFRREAFDSFGGYAAIRERVGEDWWIANRVKELKLKLRMLVGSDVLTKQFGPTFHELWQGFVKNFVLLLDGRKGMAAAALPLIVVLFLILWAPWVGVVVSIASLVTGGGSAPAALAVLFLALAQLLAVRAVRRVQKVFFGLREGALILHPLGTAVVCSMWAVAVFRTVTGLGLVWRGRVYRKV